MTCRHVLMVVLVTWVVAGCDNDQNTSQGTPQPTPPATTRAAFDQALAATILIDPVITPAAGDQGDYLMTKDGIWLLRGAEAVRVREVEQLSTTRPWVTGARVQTVPLKVNVSRD
jgi:hypothetical protein